MTGKHRAETDADVRAWAKRLAGIWAPPTDEELARLRRIMRAPAERDPAPPGRHKRTHSE